MRTRKKLHETASGGSTAAASIGGFRDYMFGTVSKQDAKNNIKKKKKQLAPVMSMYGFSFVDESFKFSNYLIESEDSDFDPTAVIAKLKSSAKSSDTEQTAGVTAFALEDDRGRIVKVWVSKDQSEEFENALGQALQANDDDEDEENTSVEIAEVLWNLRNKYDIVNVEWKEELPEDQEEIVTTGEGGDEGIEGEGIEGAGEEGEGIEGAGEGDELDAETAPAPDETQAATALQSVIDMMKADAEAKKAEAEARSKEADARIAGVEKKAAMDRVKQEEETLDMEAYYDGKKKEDDETKRLSKLAQYQHDLANDEGQRDQPMQGDRMATDDEENEETVYPMKPSQSRFMRTKKRDKQNTQRDGSYYDSRHRKGENGSKYRKRMNKKPLFRDMLRSGY